MPYRRRRSRIVRSGIPRSAPTCREVRPPCAYNKAKTSDRSAGSPAPQWPASASAARPKRHSRPAQNPGDALPLGTCQLGDAVGRQPFALIQMRKPLKTHLVLPGHRIGARRAARTRPRRWRRPCCRARTRVHEFTVDLKHAASYPLGRDRWRGTAVNGEPLRRMHLPDIEVTTAEATSRPATFRVRARPAAPRNRISQTAAAATHQRAIRVSPGSSRSVQLATAVWRKACRAGTICATACPWAERSTTVKSRSGDQTRMVSDTEIHMLTWYFERAWQHRTGRPLHPKQRGTVF